MNFNSKKNRIRRPTNVVRLIKKLRYPRETLFDSECAALYEAYRSNSYSDLPDKVAAQIVTHHFEVLAVSLENQHSVHIKQFGTFGISNVRHNSLEARDVTKLMTMEERVEYFKSYSLTGKLNTAITAADSEDINSILNLTVESWHSNL